ncbi:MAG: hypothetical protein SVR08_13885 [Spirochaetota bacterium]|nr:hypothetical protein [Spirochaetota bacterium]
MKSVKRIQKLLKGISEDNRNNVDNIYINIAKNEFIFTNESIKIPRIRISKLDYDLSVDIVKKIIKHIPEFLFEHELLEERKPPSEQHSLHLIKEIRGKLLKYIHIFKIDLKFDGNSDTIIEKGDSDHYPSYQTDRIYYKSRLIPVNKIYKDNSIIDFDPIKIFTSNYIESDQYFHTFAIFDSLEHKKITKDLHDKLSLDVFSVSTELYPFIVYDYFTACFNVPYPSVDELRRAVEYFETIFMLIYSRYNNINDILSEDEKYHNSLKLKSGILMPQDDCFADLRHYFKRFKIYRNDDLALKGWWRIDIEN